MNALTLAIKLSFEIFELFWTLFMVELFWTFVNFILNVSNFTTMHKRTPKTLITSLARIYSHFRTRPPFLRTTAYLHIARICYRPSVRLSVRHTGGSVKNGVEARIMQFSPYSSPIPLFLQDKFHSDILTGSPRSGRRTRVVWEKRAIFWFYASISRKRSGGTFKVRLTIND